MKQRHKAEEIVKIIRAVEASSDTGAAIEQAGISSATYYKWRKKYRGMDVEEAKRLKDLERENAKLKRLVAEQSLMIFGLKEINSKKW